MPNTLEGLYAQAAEATRSGSRTFFFATRYFPPELARAAHAAYWFAGYTRGLGRQAATPEQGRLDLARWEDQVQPGTARATGPESGAGSFPGCGGAAQDPAQLRDRPDPGRADGSGPHALPELFGTAGVLPLHQRHHERADGASDRLPRSGAGVYGRPGSGHGADLDSPHRGKLAGARADLSAAG